MSRVFFTSDLHLGHKNICENIRKMSVKDNIDLIVKNWNKVVTKRDTVYILGDVVMENHKHLYHLLKLNGKIRVIGGNHDNSKVCKTLNDMGITVMGGMYYKGFYCSHVPIHPIELENNRCIANIHGHHHIGGMYNENGTSKPVSLGDKYFNVNTEFHNYTPVLFEDIVNVFIDSIYQIQNKK